MFIIYDTVNRIFRLGGGGGGIEVQGWSTLHSGYEVRMLMVHKSWTCSFSCNCVRCSGFTCGLRGGLFVLLVPAGRGNVWCRLSSLKLPFVLISNFELPLLLPPLLLLLLLLMTMMTMMVMMLIVITIMTMIIKMVVMVMTMMMRRRRRMRMVRF